MVRGEEEGESEREENLLGFRPLFVPVAVVVDEDEEEDEMEFVRDGGVGNREELGEAVVGTTLLALSCAEEEEGDRGPPVPDKDPKEPSTLALLPYPKAPFERLGDPDILMEPAGDDGCLGGRGGGLSVIVEEEVLSSSSSVRVPSMGDPFEDMFGDSEVEDGGERGEESEESESRFRCLGRVC